MNLLRQRKIQLVIITVLTILAYSNIFQNQFVIDDYGFVDKSYTSKLHIISAFQGVVPPGHEGVYRPIRSLFYLLYSYLFGQNPFLYHLHSLVVHLLSTVLVYFITLELLRNREGSIQYTVLSIKQRTKSKVTPFILNTQYLIPITASLLFGLHPIHTEAITYIAASMDTTGVVFFLSSFYFYLKTQNSKLKTKYLILSYGFAIGAFFTYEMTLTLPLLLILYELTLGKTKNLKSLILNLKSWLPYFLLAGVYGGIRVFLIGATSRGPYLANSFYLTMLTMTKVFIKYLSLLLFPIHLTNNHAVSSGIEAFVYRGYRTEAIVTQSLLNVDIIIYLLILIGIVSIAVYFWKRKPLLSFCIFWFFIALLPVSEIIPQGAMLNERALYIPSFGWTLLLAIGVAQVSPVRQAQGKRVSRENQLVILLVLLIPVVLWYSYLTFQRNLDWKDGITFWSKDIQRYPTENAYAYFQRGNEYLIRKQYKKAIEDYQKAYRINPHFSVAIASVARVYQARKIQNKALEYYKKAVRVDPYFWEGWFQIGNFYYLDKNYDLAVDAYSKTLLIQPQHLQAKNNLEVVMQIVEKEKFKELRDLGLTFSYPLSWRLEKRDEELTVKTPSSVFQITFIVNSARPRSLGKLLNQGLARIPSVDEARVLIWDDNGVKKLQFFLVKDGKKVEVVVFPGDSPLMRIFDKILESLKIY